VTVTLREVMDDYLTTHRTSHGEPLRASSQADIRRHVEKNLAHLADKPIADITRDACIGVFNDISKRGAKGQANQCMRILCSLINFAREKHATADGEYTILKTNPVSMAFNKHKIGKLNKIGARKGRIPADKIGFAWVVLQQRRLEARTVDDKTAADYVAMLMLTGCRANEVATLTWDNVDLNEGWFRIPKEVAKNHNELKLPLSTVLRQILEERREAGQPPERVRRRRSDRPDRERSPYVFASWGVKGHIGEARSTLDAISNAVGVRVTRHDLRRTLDDVAARCLVSDDQRRQLLNLGRSPLPFSESRIGSP
jgi:integrase